jgi:ClpP class serine protease
MEEEAKQEPEGQPASELPASPREIRLALIRAIQKARDSHVIAYFAGDRQGAAGQIGEDAVRPMYDHVRTLGFAGVPRIDLFLYSRGGSIEAPWRIISMLREYCQELNVLIPYRAHSAATLIALGADHIVMGKKGELAVCRRA